MSKKSKANQVAFRVKQKQVKKAQQKALYESFKLKGTNSKRNKAKSSRARGKVKTTRHAVANCGNQGCSRCFSHLRLQKFNDSNDPRVRFKTLDMLRAEGVIIQ